MASNAVDTVIFAQCSARQLGQNFQSDGNSNKRPRDHWYSEFSWIPIPPTPIARRAESTDSGADCRRGGHLHNGRKMTWRTNIHMLHFRFVGNGFQLALCVGWLATRESVVLVPDPTVSAPWCCSTEASLVTARHIRRCFLRIGKSDVYQQPIAGLRSFAVLPTGAVDSSFRRGVVFPFSSHAQQPVHWQGKTCNGSTESFGIDGEPIESEWNIFPGLTRLHGGHPVRNGSLREEPGGRPEPSTGPWHLMPRIPRSSAGCLHDAVGGVMAVPSQEKERRDKVSAWSLVILRSRRRRQMVWNAQLQT